MKTSVYIGTSIDGFIARKDGDIDWLVQFANAEAVHACKEFINKIDTIVIGRGTFEKVLSFTSCLQFVLYAAGCDLMYYIMQAEFLNYFPSS